MSGSRANWDLKTGNFQVADAIDRIQSVFLKTHFSQYTFKNFFGSLVLIEGKLF